MFKLLKFFWSNHFYLWFRDKQTEQTQITPKEFPRIPAKKGSLKDISNFCDEIRKDLWIKKKTDDRLYVEMGNLKDKIERFIESRAKGA